MSTKIYNGYKLEHKNIFQLHKDFRTVFTPLWQKALIKDYVIEVYQQIDRFNLGYQQTIDEIKEYIEKQNESPYSKKVLTFDFENIETAIRTYRSKLFKDEINKNFDRENKIDPPQLIIGQDPLTGTVLVSYHGDSMFENHLEEIGLTHYGYWNNTDHPKEVTQAEWDERGRMWNDAFYGLNQPLNVTGLVCSLIGDYEKSFSYVTSIVENVTVDLPTVKERAKYMAALFTTKEFLEQLPEGVNFSDVYSDYVQYKRDNFTSKTKEIIPLIKEYNFEEEIKPYL